MQNADERAELVGMLPGHKLEVMPHLGKGYAGVVQDQ